MQLTPSLSPDGGLTFESSRALPGGSVEIVYDVSGQASRCRGARRAGRRPPSATAGDADANRPPIAGGLWHSDGVSTSVRNRPPSPGGVARALRPRRALVIAGVVLLVLLGAAAAAAYIDDQSHRDHIAPGVRIGGVDVGRPQRRRRAGRLIQRAVAPRRRTLTVHGAGRTFVLAPGQSRLTADLDAALRGRGPTAAAAGSARACCATSRAHRLNERDRAEAPLRARRRARAGEPSRRGRPPRATRRLGDPQRHGPHRDALPRRRALDAPALRRRLAAALLVPLALGGHRHDDQRRSPRRSHRTSWRPRIPPTSSSTAMTTSCASSII